eukprot:g7273.t1
MHGLAAPGGLRFVSPDQHNHASVRHRGISAELVNRALVVIALATICHLLVWFRPIIVPFCFSLFFMYLMDPLVSLLVKTPRGCWIKFARRDSRGRHFLSPLAPRAGSGPAGPRCCRGRGLASRLADSAMPRWLAVLLSLAVAVGVAWVVCFIISNSLRSLENNWGKYEVGLQRLANATGELVHYMRLDWHTQVEPQLVGAAESFAGALFFDAVQFLADAAITLVFLVYLSLSPIRPKAGVWGKIDRQVRRYIRLKTFVCALVGVTVGITLTLLGIDLAWLYALVTFIANYVPNVGAVFATLLPMPLVLLDPGLSGTRKALAFVLPTCLHAVIGNVVEPYVFGSSLELHPIIVLLSLAFWAILWGVAGMILAVPLIAVMRIVLSHLDHPYAATLVRVLEGRFFAGVAEESFRHLAADSVTSSMDASASLHQRGGGGGGVGGSHAATNPAADDMPLFVGDSAPGKPGSPYDTPVAGGAGSHQRVSILRGQGTKTKYGTG